MPETDIDFAGSARSGIQIGEMFVKAISHALVAFSRPIGLTTQIFFRHDFGERFLTPIHACAAAAVIVFTALLTMVMPDPWIIAMLAGSEATLLTRVAAGVLAFFWVAFVAGAVLEHVERTKNRYLNKQRWHSRCSGVPRHSILTNGVQYGLVAAAVVAAFASGFVVFGLLLLASVAQTAATDAWAAKEMYDRVLDSIDAEIESKNLGEAIQRQLSPRQTEGIEVKLPTRLRAAYKTLSA